MIIVINKNMFTGMLSRVTKILRNTKDLRWCSQEK